jgi:hypothetical protein
MSATDEHRWIVDTWLIYIFVCPCAAGLGLLFP